MNSFSQNQAESVTPVSPNGFAWRIVDDEALIINLASGHFYSLNQTATQVLIQELARGDLDALAEVFVQQSGRPLAIVRQDIEAFRAQLQQAEIVGLQPAPTAIAEQFPMAETYEAPCLTVYDQIVGLAPYSPE